MEKLFENGDYDATYTDDEGITPLHVGSSTPLPLAAPPDLPSSPDFVSNAKRALPCTAKKELTML